MPRPGSGRKLFWGFQETAFSAFEGLMEAVPGMSIRHDKATVIFDTTSNRDRLWRRGRTA